MDVALDKLGNSGTRSAQSLDAARSDRALAVAYAGHVDKALADLRAFAAPTPRVLGIVQRLSGSFAEALDSQRKAMREIAPGPGSSRTRSLILTEIGLNQLELGDVGPAAGSLDEALKISNGLQRRPVPERADLLVALGRAMLARKQPAQALPFLEEADGFWRQFDSESRWAGEASLWLSRIYAALGLDVESASALSRARTALSRSRLPSDRRLAMLSDRIR